MANPASKASKTVRMFDGTEYATYKVGSKKHQAAEARRAAFDATKEARSNWNKAAAAWARSKGVVPSGSAWKAITATADIASLKVKDLKALNAADSLTPPAKKAASTKAVEVVTEEVATATKPVGRKARRKARSAAAKKGWETRRANATTVVVEVEAPVVDEVSAKRAAKKASKKARKAQIAATVDPTEVTFREQLSAAGFDEAQIDLAWSLKG